MPRPFHLFRIALLFIALTLAGCGTWSPERAAGVATGFVSHQLCSASFVAHLDPDQFFRESVAPDAAPAGFLLGYHVDREHGEVTATLAGMAPSRAVYRGAYGCMVVHGGSPAQPLPATAGNPSLLPPIAGPEPVEPTTPALQAALERAFIEPDSGPARHTKAVVIVHGGRVVTERYAPEVGVNTPLLGWSATKSVTNALIGILVRQNKLSIDGPAPIAAWADPRDPRHAIAIDKLLRMSSGLSLGDSLHAGIGDIVDRSSQMLFDEADMAAYAERATPDSVPGQQWHYANGNTLLLSRIVRDRVGGDMASVYAFAHRELFDKLGMQHTTLEFDEAGTPIGAMYMWASARDWARFGLLYLHDGVAGGVRILPPGWVDYSATLTPASGDYGYGAGFWTNRGDSIGGNYRIRAGMPADAFMARGSQGQYVIVIPSADMVIVRLGAAFTPREDIGTVSRLVADAVAAFAPQ